MYFKKISLALILLFGLLFLIPSLALADTKVLLKGSKCGLDKAYTIFDDAGAFNKWITKDQGVKLSKGQTSIKCASNLVCEPEQCLSHTKEIYGLQSENGMAMTFICKDVDQDHSKLCGGDGSIKVKGFGKEEVDTCKKGTNPYSNWLSKCKQTIREAEYRKATTAACEKRGSEMERGVFTRGLSDKCLGCGDCSQCDVFQTIASIATAIFSIAGALAVLLLVNSGFGYVMAGGNQEAREKAKKGLTAVVVGLIIILVAWLVVNTILTQMLGYKLGNWFAPDFKCNITQPATEKSTLDYKQKLDLG